MPYKYPHAQKSDIESMIQEMLEDRIIQHSQIYFSSPVVMVMKKDGPWIMCLYYRHLNKMTIKYKFPILIIDELSYELHGEKYLLSWVSVWDIIKLE
jgi:hypothetical protein